MKIDIERMINGMLGLVSNRTSLAALLIWGAAGAIWWQALS